jgi:predicted regulator of Ras-like GTPase activity (Roadblock/LC7/MglB family)
MNDIILTPDVSEKLNRVVQRYVSRIELLHALVTTNSGQIIVSYGADATAIDTSSLPPLISGSFSATEKIANLIGEDEFTSMLHKGKKRTILITLIDFNLYLTSVFSNTQHTPVISYAATTFAKKLRTFLHESGLANQ